MMPDLQRGGDKVVALSGYQKIKTDYSAWGWGRGRA